MRRLARLNLKADWTPLLPEILNGEFVSTTECVPIELPRRPDRPRSTPLDDLQRSVNELKDEIEHQKSERH
jgi:hypothetical protein